MASTASSDVTSNRSKKSAGSRKSGGLGRGKSPYFKKGLTFPSVTADLPSPNNSGDQDDQKAAKDSPLKDSPSQIENPVQTADQSPPPKPPRKRSPRPKSKIAEHSQATNGTDQSPSSTPPQPSRHKADIPPTNTDTAELSPASQQSASSNYDTLSPSTDAVELLPAPQPSTSSSNYDTLLPNTDTVYLPPATQQSSGLTYDSLLPKRDAEMYDHLGPTTDLAALLPNTLSRYSKNSEAQQKPAASTATEEHNGTDQTGNTTTATINGDDREVPIAKKPLDSKGEPRSKKRDADSLKGDEHAVAPWSRKLPRVVIKDEPEKAAHPWRNMQDSSIDPPSLIRDLEYSMEPRNFSQRIAASTTNKFSLGADAGIKEEEKEVEETSQDNDESNKMTEENRTEEQPILDTDEKVNSHPWRQQAVNVTISLAPASDTMPDLEYSMEPRNASRDQQTAATLPATAGQHKVTKKKKKDGKKKKKKVKKLAAEQNESKKTEEQATPQESVASDQTGESTEGEVIEKQRTDINDKMMERIEEEDIQMPEHRETMAETAAETNNETKVEVEKIDREHLEGREEGGKEAEATGSQKANREEMCLDKGEGNVVEANGDGNCAEQPLPSMHESPQKETVQDDSSVDQSKTVDPASSDQPLTKDDCSDHQTKEKDEKATPQISYANFASDDSSPELRTSPRKGAAAAKSTSSRHQVVPRRGSFGEADSLKGKSGSFTRDDRKRATVYAVASPSGSFSSGVEESIGWGFMTPSSYEQQLAPYVAKPGAAAPSKSRWQGFKLSLRGEKKAQSIFNPKNKEKLIKYLVNPKVDVNATNDSGQTVLHSYVHSDRPDKLELLVTLLSHCNSKLLQIDKADRYGNSALLVAVEMNDLPSVKALLAFGANINCQNTFGETPIDRVVKQYQYGNRDELHELLSRLHAVPGKGMPSPSAMQEPLNESINSIVNESYEIVEDQQLGVYLEPKRLTAFVFKLEEMMRRQNLEYSVNTNLSIPPGFQDHNRTFFDPMIARESQLLRISEWKSTLDFNLGAGSRMLILDGGGIRGLIEIEILEKIEKLTGRRIVELFDWIIGTSTGGIIALALVYLGISLAELRQLYFRMREEVLCGGLMSVSKKTDALEHLLRSTFGNMNMRDKEYPKVMIGAVSTKQNPPLLHFFNNCFNDEFSGHLVWKVARYTSAGPGYFSECDRYMDGGVLANNPSLAAWTDINTFCRATHTPPPRIAMVVSLGTGVYPPEQMGSTDILGKGRFLDLTGTLRRVQRFIKMLATALSESDKVAVTFKATCDAAKIKFFRLSPTLSSVIPPDEIDPQVVVDMIMLTKEYLGIQSTQRSLDEIVKLFRHIADISRGLNLEK